MRRRAPNRLRPNTEPTITQAEAVDRIAPHLRTGKDAGEVDRVLKGRVRKKIAYAVKIGALTPLPRTRRVFNRNRFRKWAAKAWPATPTDALGPGRAAFHEPKAYSIKATPPVKRRGSKLVAQTYYYPFNEKGFAACLERIASLQAQVISLQSEVFQLKRERDALRTRLDAVGAAEAAASALRRKRRGTSLRR